MRSNIAPWLKAQMLEPVQIPALTLTSTCPDK